MNYVEQAEVEVLERRRIYEAAVGEFQVALGNQLPREEVRRCYIALKEKEREVFDARRRMEVLQSQFQREAILNRGRTHE